MKFSQFYLPPQEYITDSQKMRVRIGTYIYNLSFHTNIGNYSLADYVTQHSGIIVPMALAALNQYFYDFKKLCNEEGIVDLLDIITIVHDAITESSKKRELTQFVNKCFVEEGLAYVMNQQGEIRFRPDEEFERNRIMTLKSLTENNFSTALEAYNHAYNEFQSDVQKGKSAIRYIFEANEILFKKLAKPKHTFDQLNSRNIEPIKKFILDNIVDHLDNTAKLALNKFFESYKDWVDGMHPYRHGHDLASYDNPPVDITIYALSSGASYLRLLAAMVKMKAEKEIKLSSIHN